MVRLGKKLDSDQTWGLQFAPGQKPTSRFPSILATSSSRGLKRKALSLTNSVGRLMLCLRFDTWTIGPDNSILFLHKGHKNTRLVYDLMELWRTSSDYSVIQTLERLNFKDKNRYLTDTYEAMLSQKTILLLFDNFRFNLSLEKLILNVRRLTASRSARTRVWNSY
jgi:hypothetical protein